MSTSVEQFSLQQIASNLSVHPARDSNISNSLTIIGCLHSAGDPNISADKTILGDLSTSGSVRLDGVIEGNIYCTSLIIMVNGRVNGGIIANQEVIVQGKVTGSIRSRSVMLQSSAKVEGDIFCQRIDIEMGARHDGMVHPTGDEHVSNEFGKQDNSEATCNTTKIADQPKEPQLLNRPTVSNESQSPA
jgi:cytoskeletal protein CcmA (bactofilin family)